LISACSLECKPESEGSFKEENIGFRLEISLCQMAYTSRQTSTKRPSAKGKQVTS
jgi:hypothetical protein